jgi:peptidoglycan/LPS O-acetylase OafA/YrhL
LIATRATLRHIPALDGLRGVALLGVLLFHANGALPGGYLGVDLFFVLSGFLITSLLLTEHRGTGRIALSSFWLRRARRLFPALLALMPAIAIYGRFFAKPNELADLRADALATLGYVANWRAIVSEKSYWELFMAPSPLEHTWSLSIEEQFYIVWPLIVALVLRRYTKRAVLAIALLFIALSMTAMMVFYDPARLSRVYLGTDTRAAGILIGAALAAACPADWKVQGRTVRWLDPLGVIAAIGLGIAWYELPGESSLLYHGGFWLTEGAAAILILCAAMIPSSLVARVFALRPLTVLGTVSYGVYLWHWPVNVFLTPERVHLRGFWLQVSHFAVTFVIAGLSYRFIERPIQTRGIPFGRPLYVVPAAVALAVLLVVRATYARQTPQTQQIPMASLVPPESAVPIGLSPPAFQILLLGDSTANSLGWGLRGLREPGVAVELKGQDGCTMLADRCGGSEWPNHVANLQPDATLVVLGGAFMHGIAADGEWRKACTRQWDEKFRTTLSHRLSDVAQAGKPVWVLTTPYALGVWEDAAIHREVDCINTSIRKASASVPAVQLLDLGEHLCPKGECTLEFEGAVIRPDGVHYSIEGAHEVAHWVLDRIQRGGSARDG